MGGYVEESDRHATRYLVVIVVMLCITLPVARAAESTGAVSVASTVPATYYGSVLAGPGLTPAPGMPVSAFIDGRACGQSRTQ